MTGNGPPTLLDYLTQRYASLKLRLTRKLGNADLASDALHDTWLRLQDKDGSLSPGSPAAYLMRVATNIAVDMQRVQNRTVSGEEVDALLEAMADAAPDPARQAQGRRDLEAVTELLAAMPERRRVIVVMVHWQDMTRQAVADRLGVSRRTVDYELQRAHERLDAFYEARLADGEGMAKPRSAGGAGADAGA
ncbi:RNA polymerase sigma factor [Orrella sp. JC864]|uniref:RNA polymerase sigma factor n=1 Tax=Orrella sp. JC864 TaxID=3120298 RepID=UPI00300B0B1E